MAHYHIEVYRMGELVHSYETDAFREAKRIYLHYDRMLDCWTQLWVDGLTGSKAWMNQQIADPRAAWRGFKFSDGGNEK